MKFSLPLVLFLGVSTLSACSSDTPPVDERDGGGGQGGEHSRALTSLQKVIGPDGGSIAIDAASLDFPPGALSEDQEISLTELREADVAPLPAGAAFASPPVAFEPHGLSFDAPVAVNLSFGGAVGKRFVVAKLDDENDKTWEKGADAAFEDGKATFTISSFSIWAVVDDVDGAFDEPTGTGGTGGTGGGSSAGYFETGELFGFARVDEIGGASVSSTNVETGEGLPYCVAGTLPAPFGTEVRLGFDLGVSEIGGEQVAHEPVNAGLRFVLDNPGADYIVARIRTAAGDEFCQQSIFDGISFMNWTDFTSDCFEGTPYDGVSPIEYVGFGVASNGETENAYELCVEHLDDAAPLPQGYFIGETFHGYVSSLGTGGANITSGPEGNLAGQAFCVTGDAGGAGQSVGMRLNLNETEASVASSYSPTSDGLDFIGISNAYGDELQAQISDGTTTWCAPVRTNVQPFFVPWADFNTDCVAYVNGDPYDDGINQPVPVGSLVLQHGPVTEATPVSFCFEDIVEVPAPVTGQFITDTWAGFGTVSVFNGVPPNLENLQHNTGYQRSGRDLCMSGDLAADTGAFVTMMITLDQPVGEAPLLVDILGDQLDLDVTGGTNTAAMKAVLFDGSDYYCAPITVAFQSVPWNTFKDCLTDTNQFLGTQVEAVGVRATAKAGEATSFDVCVANLSESTLTQ